MHPKITCCCRICWNWLDSGLVDISTEKSQFSVGRCSDSDTRKHPHERPWNKLHSLNYQTDRSRQRAGFHGYCTCVIWRRRVKAKGTKGEKCVCVITLHTSKGCGHSCITRPHFPSAHAQSKSSLTHLAGTASIHSIKSYCFRIPRGRVRPSSIH